MYILISSCLIGLNVKWNGKSKNIADLKRLVSEGKAIFLCPEQIGGLSTPRVPAEIEAGRTAKEVLEGKAKIIGNNGSNLTEEIIRGSNETLKFCKEYGIKIAILRDGSPTCGSVKTYSGRFDGVKIKGRGVLTELLEQNGIKVYNEFNFPKDL